jgi:glutamine synthetase
LDLVGRWRHLTIPVSRLTEDVFLNGFGFDASNYGYAKVEDSDMVYVPDLKTAFPDPFFKERTLSFMGHIYEITPEGLKPFNHDPRFILKKALQLMKDKDIGDQFMIGPEFEFYVFDGIQYQNQPNAAYYEIFGRQAGWSQSSEAGLGYTVQHKGGYHIDVPGDTYGDLRNEMVMALEKNGLAVKYHHHEVGAIGQQEIEIEMGDAAVLADYSMLIKYFVKNIAYRRGKTATFMPKPLHGEAGSGFHVHMQIFKEGSSLFAGDDKNLAGLSELAMYFMGGILKHSPSLLGLASPSTNSYKRLVRGYEAPVLVCFAESNRTAVVRIPRYARDPEDRRFEFRPSDATANPYLTYAALLLAGIDGIVNKIDPISEGYGPLTKNIYDLPAEERALLKSLPTSLKEALEELEKDHHYLLQGDVFDQAFLKNWITTKYNEIDKVEHYPHPREFEVYYDL